MVHFTSLQYPAAVCMELWATLLNLLLFITNAGLVKNQMDWILFKSVFDPYKKISHPMEDSL